MFKLLLPEINELIPRPVVLRGGFVALSLSIFATFYQRKCFCCGNDCTQRLSGKTINLSNIHRVFSQLGEGSVCHGWARANF